MTNNQTLPFNVSDTVTHTRFGIGTVISITMDQDAHSRNLAKYPQDDGCFQKQDLLVTICFDEQSIGHKTFSLNIVATMNLLTLVHRASFPKAS